MNRIFAQNLKLLMTQLRITNSQLAKALHVDPSLICHWRKNGCGQGKATEHARAIEEYVMRLTLTPENMAWLSNEIGTTPGSIAYWLNPTKETLSLSHSLLSVPRPDMVDAVRPFVENHPLSYEREPDAYAFACNGTSIIAETLGDELSKLSEGAEVGIHLSSESSNAAIDAEIRSVIIGAVKKQKLVVRMLVESANNTQMANRLIRAYMPLIVDGKLTLSVIQGTPQTFTASMSIIVPEHSVLIITEAMQRRTTAVGTIIRDSAIVQDMQSSFADSIHFARPLLTTYNDSFARNIVEVFFEEYGVPGGLDVIKCGLNPMYMTVEQYGKVLREFRHTEDQYKWRYSEFARFKEAMDNVFVTSRFREILSLPKLREIAETGCCRMPAMYFFGIGTWKIDAQDCVNILDGYIHYLETVPNFQVILLEDESLFLPNSCWHIKNNRHIMIHTWNIDDPMMVFSDQLMLIDEFQDHFEKLWENTGKLSSRQSVIYTLAELRNKCAGRINANK